MKVSDYIIDFLVSRKVTHVFEVCGGAITHLLDSLYGRKDIKTISMHHEQAAAFAAEGYARIKGKAGVAMATSGPGATNLITGIASCFFDSIPCVFITGQVNTYEFKYDALVRQMGFQETDIINVVKPIVKEAIFVSDPGKIRYSMEKAFYLAEKGRPGPVLIDIPMDVQRAEISPGKPETFKPRGKNVKSPAKKTINKISRLLNGSKRPVILAGGGVKLARADKVLRELVRKTGIPVCSTLMGLGAFPGRDKNFVGMIGTYGNRCANLAVANSDLLIAIGTRFDTRQTGTNPASFARGAKVVHVDIDKAELNNKIMSDVAVNSDAAITLRLLKEKIGRYDKTTLSSWRKTVETYKENYSGCGSVGKKSMDPNTLMSRVSELMPGDTAVFVDVGQNQMWASQSLRTGRSQNLFTQGGMGAMGSALSMAIGAAFTGIASSYLVISGDGGFQLNIQELETVRHYNLPIKILLINNGCYGMVRQFQEQYFKSRFQSTVKGYSSPDFVKVVSAYGIHSYRLINKRDLSKKIKRLFGKKGPVFLEAKVGKRHKVSPKLSVDMPIEKQDPQLSREEMESSMLIDF